ncbi:hypothetical protein COOONC_14754 [Cooperia oncophora]
MRPHGPGGQSQVDSGPVCPDLRIADKSSKADELYCDRSRGKVLKEHMAVLDNMRTRSTAGHNSWRQIAICKKCMRASQTLNQDGFERIGLGLKEMYQMLTLGGDASLDLKDSMDPFTQGIQFMWVLVFIVVKHR